MQNQVEPQAVINSLLRQITEQAQKIAFLEAFAESLKDRPIAQEEKDMG